MLFVAWVKFSLCSFALFTTLRSCKHQYTSDITDLHTCIVVHKCMFGQVVEIDCLKKS